MMSRPSDTEDDRLFETLIGQAGQPEEPSPRQMQAWRHQLEAGLAARRRQRRWTLAGVGGALAASLVLAVLLMPGAQPPAPGAPVARVVTAVGGNMAQRQGTARRALAPGDALVAGELVESGMRSALGVRLGTTDLRVDARSRLRFEAGSVELLAGRIYVDSGVAPDAAGARATPVIVTPRGTIRDVGTQYVVAVTADSVTAAVREGTIVFDRENGDLRLAAPADGARQVTIDASGELRRSDGSGREDLWSWALAASPGLSVAGRSAHEVLSWAARERGQRLAYASEVAQRTARQVVLGGSAPPSGPEQAVLDVAGAAPSLEIREQDGVLLVALKPRTGAPR